MNQDACISIKQHSRSSFLDPSHFTSERAVLVRLTFTARLNSAHAQTGAKDRHDRSNDLSRDGDQAPQAVVKLQLAISPGNKFDLSDFIGGSSE